MKKLLALSMLPVLGLNATAQVNLTSKHGLPILPEAGNWALGFSAVPVFSYLGNMFNGTQDQNPPFMTFPSGSPMASIYLKKCRTATDFWRLRARLAVNLEVEKHIVDDKQTNTDTIPFNETLGVDSRNSASYVVALGGGREKRRGSGRLQVYYGPEIWLGITGNSWSWTYHNPTDPDMTQGSPALLTYTSGTTSGGKRVVRYSNGTAVFMGVQLFGGVEFFFMPKVSIGAELGWGVTTNLVGKQTQTTEYWEASLNGGAGGVRTETLQTEGGSMSLMLDQMADGAFNLYFYF